jgi:hypothetical protein
MEIFQRIITPFGVGDMGIKPSPSYKPKPRNINHLVYYNGKINHFSSEYNIVALSP